MMEDWKHVAALQGVPFDVQGSPEAECSIGQSRRGVYLLSAWIFRPIELPDPRGNRPFSAGSPCGTESPTAPRAC